MTLEELNYNDKINGKVIYGRTAGGALVAMQVTADGLLKVDTELTATINPAGLATEQGLDDILAKLTSDPSTATLQTSGNASLTNIDGKLSKVVQLHANIDFSSASAQTIIAAPGAG